MKSSEIRVPQCRRPFDAFNEVWGLYLDFGLNSDIVAHELLFGATWVQAIFGLAFIWVGVIAWRARRAIGALL